MPGLIPGGRPLCELQEALRGVRGECVGVRNGIVHEPRSFPLLSQGLKNEHMRYAVARTGTVEIRGTRDHAGEAPGLPFFYERRRNPRADFALFAAGVERCFLGHGTADLAIHVDIVKEDELCAGSLAGFDSVGHYGRPHFLPDLVVVLEAHEQTHNTGTGNGAYCLVLVRQIGGDYFSCAGGLPRFATDEAERLIPCVEKCSESVADAAASSKYGDHSGPPFWDAALSIISGSRCNRTHDLRLVEMHHVAGIGH